MCTYNYYQRQYIKEMIREYQRKIQEHPELKNDYEYYIRRLENELN